MDPITSQQFMTEMLDTRGDLLTKIKERGLSMDDLMAWAREPDNLRQLRNVCVLCDLQAQTMLSRYRMLAINRLYQLASQDDKEDRHTRETVRRACVDLARLELRRAYRAPRGKAERDSGEEASLREMLYGLVMEAEGEAKVGGDAKPRAGEGG